MKKDKNPNKNPPSGISLKKTIKIQPRSANLASLEHLWKNLQTTFGSGNIFPYNHSYTKRCDAISQIWCPIVRKQRMLSRQVSKKHCSNKVTPQLKGLKSSEKGPGLAGKVLVWLKHPEFSPPNKHHVVSLNAKLTQLVDRLCDCFIAILASTLWGLQKRI